MPLPFQSAKTVPTICPVPRERSTAAAAIPAGMTREVPVEKFCVTRNIDRVVHGE